MNKILIIIIIIIIFIMNIHVSSYAKLAMPKTITNKCKLYTIY